MFRVGLPLVFRENAQELGRQGRETWNFYP